MALIIFVTTVHTIIDNVRNIKFVKIYYVTVYRNVILTVRHDVNQVLIVIKILIVAIPKDIKVIVNQIIVIIDIISNAAITRFR